MPMNLFTHHCNTKIQIGYHDLKHNKSKCEYRLAHLTLNDSGMINKLLGTKFTKITNVLYNQRFLDTRYNIDIVFHGDTDGATKKYGLELDGVFYHGLKELKQTYKYYKVMQERKRQHQTKGLRLKDRMNEGVFEDIFHVADVEFIKFEQDNDIKIEIPPQYNISNRSILQRGRTECYTHYREIDRPNEKLYGIGFTSLYPSGMVFGNLPLRDLIVGTQAGSLTYTKSIDSKDIAKYTFKLDQAYIDNLIEYVNNIPRQITAEERLQYYLAGCDKMKRVIQIKCQMLPPRDLKFPVLGCHICNKLLFPLCRTCAEQQCLYVNNHKSCKDNNEQRYLTGFWHETELINTLYEGYKFREIYETHTYQVSTFNDNEYQGGNFINSEMFNKTLNPDQDVYKDEDDLKQLANDCDFDYIYNDGMHQSNKRVKVNIGNLNQTKEQKHSINYCQMQRMVRQARMLQYQRSRLIRVNYFLTCMTKSCIRIIKLNQLNKYDQEYLCIRRRVVINIKNLIKCILGRNDNSSSKNYAQYINKICK
ncbi:hypothetical protein SS50377_25155 [Spironucleus salmonicida]|uniref:DNA-directed DNA polymerase n=1 Tax=Spironucleus salmonicida TaxID=348837 RepID=A0A9P8RY02_9EUKA|nr:hypothetical protein SS50377_25155 [Spironucleus salmonicida]